MKLNGNMVLKETPEVLARDPHIHKSISPVNNPVKNNQLLNDETKIQLIADKFKGIMEVLGLDLSDDSLRDTPRRVAKMYVNEIFKGLDPRNKPKITVFKNTYQYSEPLVEMNIPFTSFCEHHFVPIVGTANVAYTPGEHVIGLSKIHRLVDYYARRPQVQERLTQQILKGLCDALETEDVGVVLRASHSCIKCRGIQHKGSSTITSTFSGRIAENQTVVNLLMT